MISRVKARAYANIALVKYWGKREGDGNLPATPSISLALDSLVTETEVSRSDSSSDGVSIDGSAVDDSSRSRIADYLEYWRDKKLIDGHFHIKSTNSFPTASGLASSASGFAALATALGKFSESPIGKIELSRLARRGSGSAARSIPGGLAAMPTGSDPAARLLMPASDIEWGMVVAVVQESEKEIGSRAGMELSRKTSPYYSAWIACAKRDYTSMLKSISKCNFTEIGQIAEQNALAMHACMIASRPQLVYWNDITVRLIKCACEYRQGGLETYITIDAGANVVFFCRLDDLDNVKDELEKRDGVKSVIKAGPAPGAEVLEWE